jgi:hypothetical protein
LNLKPETLNLLQIGWASLNPITVSENGTVLLIHARLIEPASSIRHPVSSIRFTLNPNPLSELADGNGNVIDDAKLTVADASPLLIAHSPLISVYPNPVKDILHIEYLMETDGTYNAELFSLQGVVLIKSSPSAGKAGLNKAALNLRDLPNGAYMLKASFGNYQKVTKVIVNR